MKIIIRTILFIISLILITNGIIYLKISPTNLGALLTLMMGNISLIIFFYFNPIFIFVKSTKIGKILFLLLSIALILFITVELIIIFNGKKQYSEHSDAIIILGAGLKGERITLVLHYRLERALKYLNKYPNTYVVVSGGQGPGESITEAEAMKRYLLSKGIDGNRIILEDQSTSTTENFKFSKKLLDEKLGQNQYTVCFSTNNFHIYRAGKIAEKQGLIAYGLSAPDVWYMTVVNHIREFFAVLKFWILGY